VRNKFLYMILFFGLIFILFSVTLGQLTLGNDDKIIVDFGLAMIEIFGLIGVIFVGSQLLFKEVDGKTIFLILSKPIDRYEFILGKFLGFSGTIALIILVQSLLFLGVLLLKDIEITIYIVMSLLFTFFKLEILLSLVFFFSTFVSNIVTVLVTVMIYFASHSFSHLMDLAVRSKNITGQYIVKGLEVVFPPMQALNIKDVIGSFTNFSHTYFIYNSVYAVVYVAVILYFSVLIFNRKKFES
ncbi:ABC transporter permease subunit, partial [Candidatus Gracilibacteria bacterium]|nr:ABC transporter permease subunit [Candidatus Gracilibacteria bacterium]